MKLNGFLLGCATLFTTPIFALNPIPGTYGGVVIGGSYMFPVTAPNINPLMLQWTASNPTLANYLTSLNAAITRDSTYNIKYGFMGLLGFQLGFRCDNFRVEGQFMYESNPVSSLSINSVQVPNRNKQLAYPSGQTNIIGGLANFYYDLLPPTDCDANYAPFVGFGLGYVNVQNNFNFNYNGTQLNTRSLGQSASTGAGQLMAGLLYFVDDYTWFGLDCRLFSTMNISLPEPYNKTNINYAFISGNLTFNGHFDLLG